MNSSDAPERSLQARLLLAPRIEGDRLMLADDTLHAALAGTRALTAGERAALQASPLTLRRFRHLALEARAAAPGAVAPGEAAPDAWQGSPGMLRAASGGFLSALATDDGHWALHFVAAGPSWNMILALNAAAPFAARLLREQPLLRVRDGSGAVLLQGRLDPDGECECAWPGPDAPAPHFQRHGASFAVEPVGA